MPGASTPSSLLTSTRMDSLAHVEQIARMIADARHDSRCDSARASPLPASRRCALRAAATRKARADRRSRRRRRRTVPRRDRAGAPAARRPPPPPAPAQAASRARAWPNATKPRRCDEFRACADASRSTPAMRSPTAATSCRRGCCSGSSAARYAVQDELDLHGAVRARPSAAAGVPARRPPRRPRLRAHRPRQGPHAATHREQRRAGAEEPGRPDAAPARRRARIPFRAAPRRAAPARCWCCCAPLLDRRR